MREIVEASLLVFAALLPIVNPLGGAPVFLAMTADCTAELRAAIAGKIATNAFFLLLGSVFVGSYVLEFFGLSIPIVQVAGGIVVCAAGWELLRHHDDVSTVASAPPTPSAMASRAFYPLTLPLTVGPGSISIAITLGANHPHSVQSFLVTGIGHLLGVLLTAGSILVAFRYAERIMRALGATGASVVLRLSAFILLCIGVQIFWNGFRALANSLPALAR